MSDKILSQSEIEALLNAIDETDAESPAADGVPVLVSPEPVERGQVVRAYDFRRPNKFAKDHIRALRILHGSFARMFSSALTSYLRVNVDVQLTMVEQVIYDEYIRSLGTPTVVYIVSLPPLPGQVVVELNLPVVLTIVDYLMGGDGSGDYSKPRELTEIETRLLQTVGNMINTSLADMWRSTAPIQPQMQPPVLTPEFVQVTLPGETTAMLSYEVRLPKATGSLSMCLPHPVLAPVLDRVAAQVWSTPGTEEDEVPHLPMQALLHPVQVPVIVQLGVATLSLRQVLEMPDGAVIRLDTHEAGELRVIVGDSPKFLGLPRQRGRHPAVQITRILSKEATRMAGELDPTDGHAPDPAALANGAVNGAGGAHSAAFGSPSAGEATGDSANIDLLLDVGLQVSVELGRKRMSIGELLALRAGSVIELDKLAGEPADILVNGLKIARGEVVVVDEKFGVRVMDIIARAKRIATMG